MNFQKLIIWALIGVAIQGCNSPNAESSHQSQLDTVVLETQVKPYIVSCAVKHDTDDPAIWINKQDPSKSLIIGTDKGGEEGDGALYVFDLEGNIVDDKTVRNIARPNNVDIAYGLKLGDSITDIAVLTERYTNSIRVFSLPDMQPLDNGGLKVFEGDSLKEPMGIALYTDPLTGNIYAIVGRKTGPQDGTYLWQYLLESEGGVSLKANLVRKFGNFSGLKEIEAIAVDNELGFVYFSDENSGIRKYYAHPDSSTIELAHFGQSDFTEDHEGISIYKNDDGTGYLIVSDQQANRFNIYTREGTPENPHDHQLVKSIQASTIESDGNDVVSISLGAPFEQGIFVAMSDDKTFQFYRVEDLLKDLELK